MKLLPSLDTVPPFHSGAALRTVVTANPGGAVLRGFDRLSRPGCFYIPPDVFGVHSENDRETNNNKNSQR